MMLQISLDLKEEGKEIEKAIQTVLEKGYRTPDLYEEGTNQIKVGTKEITDKIIEEL